MKEQISELVDDKIKDLNVFVSDAFYSEQEGKKLFNIVLDSEDTIDLNLITEASRIINKIKSKMKLYLDENQLYIHFHLYFEK